MTTSVVTTVKETLETKLDAIKSVLPAGLQGQATRLINRALLTFTKNPGIQEINPNSFCRLVVEAAELGLAIDGKLAHAVPYYNKDKSAKDLVLIVDYKGKIAVAKRSGSIKDCFADVVCEKDHFNRGVDGSAQYLHHSFDHKVTDRGDVVGAYAIVALANDIRNHAWVSRAELDKIQETSKAKDGPWKAWPNEMRKKTAIHRVLKMYCHDESIQTLIQQEEELETLGNQRPVQNVAPATELIDDFFSAPESQPMETGK